MAKKSSRTRAQRKRADYRKGGHVERKGFDSGGDSGSSQRWTSTTVGNSGSFGADYSGTNTSNFMGGAPVTDLSEDYSGMLGEPTDKEVAAKEDAALKAAMEKAAAKGATAAPVTDLSQSYSGMIGDPNYQAGEVSNEFAGQSGRSVGIGGEGFNDFVPKLPKLPNVTVGPIVADPVVTTDAVSAIPADGNYTQAETQAVQDAIAAGTITAAEVAAKFGVTEAQVTQEIKRREAVAKGETLPDNMVYLPRDPMAPPREKSPLADPYADTTFRNMEAEKATADAATAAVAAIPADGDYTQFEAQQVVDAINSGAMTAEQAAQMFGATTAQVEAEMIRQNQAAAGEEVTVADPFAEGVYEATKGALAKKAKKAAEVVATEKETKSREALDAVGKDVSFKDKLGEDAYVPGSFLRDYLAVDKQALVQQQTATSIDRTGTITAETAIEQLAEFDGVDVPDNVTSSNIAKAVGAIKKAVNEGTVLPGDYKAALVGELAKTIPAFTGAPVEAVMAELRALTTPAKAEQLAESEAASRRASGVDYVIDAKTWVPSVDGTTAQVSDTPEAEAATRAVITGAEASGTEAEIINTVGFQARQRAVVTGTAAVGAAANALVAIGNIPTAIAAATVEDPASVAAMIDTEPVEVQAAIAALPEEALVSAQMQSLLGGMESGVIPAWARPAVSAVEQKLASRGLGISTVGRDALFNAVIQTALPMAQSNAQALQANAAQNLTNQQQSNIEAARLNATRKLSNLSNQQTSASQTAQFAQNLKVLQSQQNQEATLLSAQNQQQTNVQNLQNRQRTAELQSQNQQQINSQELGNSQQIELAELEIKNQTEQQNMTAVNQERLAEFQVASDFLAKNAGFKQQMELANLTNDQQMRLANLSSRNQAGSENLSAEQQTELANLNVKMQTNITSANLAAEMNVAQLNVDQQRAITNATTQSKIDLTKFSTAQQVELANSAFMQNTSLANLNTRQQTALQNATAMASLDLSTADSRTKLSIENARNFLQIQAANLSNEQQSLVLDTQMKQQSLLSEANAENVARQFGATSENQVNMFIKSQADAMEQFNSTQFNAMEQFNVSESNRLSALDEQNSLEAAKFNAQIETQVEQFNAGVENQRDIWNSSNAQAIEQANTNWRRQSNTADTAAINAANAQNVQNSYGISTQELDFVWNAIRDDATFLKKEALDTANQKTNMYITAMNNESNTAINTTGVASGVTTLIDTIFD